MRLLYVGLHPHTSLWLSKEHQIVAVADLSEYLLRPAVWLPDLVLQYSYQLSKVGMYPLARAAYKVFSFLHPWCSQVFKRYAPFIKQIAEENIALINIDNVPAVERLIREEDIDLMVVNAWSLLPKSLIHAPRLGTVNVHPSKLPAYRGAVPTLWALKEGEREIAVSFLLVGKDVDGGELLAQYPVPIPLERDALMLEREVDTVIAAHFSHDLIRYASGQLKAKSQLGTPSTTPKYKEYQEIKFKTEDALNIANKIALYPYLEPFLFCFARLGSLHIAFHSGGQPSSQVLTAGSFEIRGMHLLIGTRTGTCAFRLFKDMSVLASCRFLLHTHGTFDA